MCPASPASRRTSAPGEPGNRGLLAPLGEYPATLHRDRPQRRVVELGPGYYGDLGVEQLDQTPDETGLRLTSLPEQDDVVPGEDCRSNAGMTVSPNPTIPGKRSAPVRRRSTRLWRSSSLTVRSAHPESSSSPSVLGCSTASDSPCHGRRRTEVGEQTGLPCGGALDTLRLAGPIGARQAPTEDGGEGGVDVDQVEGGPGRGVPGRQGSRPTGIVRSSSPTSRGPLDCSMPSATTTALLAEHGRILRDAINTGAGQWRASRGTLSSPSSPPLAARRWQRLRPSGVWRATSGRTRISQGEDGATPRTATPCPTATSGWMSTGCPYRRRRARRTGPHCSAATAELVQDALPDGVTLTYLGTHALRDVPSRSGSANCRSTASRPSSPPSEPSASAPATSPLPHHLRRSGGGVGCAHRPGGQPSTGHAGEAGGTGKSRLAIEVGRAVDAEFSDGVWFIRWPT